MTAATAAHLASPGRARVAGMRTALPFTLVFLPYGLVIGATADQAGVDNFLGWCTSWLT